jgi:acetate kinase
VREAICGRLEHLGVVLDGARNAADARVITAERSPCTALVLPADEERIIARHTVNELTASIPPRK